jgi:Flp pilus assembly protein TadG
MLAKAFLNLMRRKATRFSISSRGNVAVTFAVAAVPFTGAIGAAIDYSRVTTLRTNMQTALDSTALALAKVATPTMSEVDLQKSANDIFNANFVRSDAHNLSVKASFSKDDGGTVTVTGSASTPPRLMNVLGFKSLPFNAQSKAAVAMDGKVCVLALNPTASSTATTSGSSVVNLTGCSLQDNSDNSTALNLNGGGSITALSVNVTGGISGAASITASSIMTGATPLRDPYSETNFPAFTGCDYNNLNVKKQQTLNPGVYCNGFSLNAGADVTLNPGIYYMDRGTFTVNGGASIKGNNVTIVFTSSTGSNYATANINGGATVNLTPPVSGPTQGIVMFEDRKAPVGLDFKLNGGGSQIIGGAIYLSKGAIEYAGGADSSSNCTQMIGDTIKWTGNAKFAINCAGYGTKPIGMASLRLTY